MTESYRTCSIKRTRRTGANLQNILNATKAVIREEKTLTLRHLFYRLVTAGVLDKTESEYGKLSGYTMSWRRSGAISWDAFIDSSRWYYGSQTFNNLGAALENSKACFRRNLWQSQDAYVEIWTEKDAISAICSQAANPFGVRVFPLKGFASGSALAVAANTFIEQQKNGKQVFVYYLGDHDPSGRCIESSAIENLLDDHDCDINFNRIAVTPVQILRYNLPTRPTKMSDSRSKNFVGESVEVDALSPKVIRSLVERNITSHIDQVVWQREMEIEKMEKDTLSYLISKSGVRA